MARTLPVDELAGIEFLLKSPNKALAPRSKQESENSIKRELNKVAI